MLDSDEGLITQQTLRYALSDESFVDLLTSLKEVGFHLIDQSLFG